MYIVHQKKGQTLILLLVFMVIAITITTSSILILATNTTNATKLQQSTVASQVAESGIENALLRLLRDPNYSGETLPVGEGTAVTTISGSPPIIISQGTVGNFVRTIKVITSYNNGILTISSWQEINP